MSSNSSISQPPIADHRLITDWRSEELWTDVDRSSAFGHDTGLQQTQKNRKKNRIQLHEMLR